MRCLRGLRADWATRAIDRLDLPTGRGLDSLAGHGHNDIVLATTPGTQPQPLRARLVASTADPSATAGLDGVGAAPSLLTWISTASATAA